MNFLKKLSRSNSKALKNEKSGNTTDQKTDLSRKSTMDTPPAYSIQAPLIGASDGNEDSPYAFLGQFDTVFLIDDSGSMAGSRWRETAAALSAITPICTQFDANGIDIYFLNARNPHTTDALGGFTHVTSETAVQNIFNTVLPARGTPTGTRLNAILKGYISDLSKCIAKGKESQQKPLNIIVITDGAATDDVESAIVSAAKKLDKMGAVPWQVGIQFFQVGNDAAASKDLRELDDALSEVHDVRDMVDTFPFKGDNGQLTAAGIMKVTMGAVNRRLDRKSVADADLRKS